MADVPTSEAKSEPVTSEAEQPKSDASTKPDKKPDKKPSKQNISNSDLEQMTEKPFAERKEIPIGRGGALVKPRKYHMTDEEYAKIKEQAKATGGWPNPYGARVGLYYFQVEALHRLGDDQWHSFKTVFAELEKVMDTIAAKRPSDNKPTTAWRNFVDRKPRKGVKNAKDAEGKVHQNFKVMQRIDKDGRKERNPYGRKLQQCCMAIDIKFVPAEGASDPTLGTFHYRLNTKFKTPEEAIPTYENPTVRRGKPPAKGSDDQKATGGVKKASGASSKKKTAGRSAKKEASQKPSGGVKKKAPSKKTTKKAAK